MELYKTIRQQATAEQTIERSRFIAHARPVADRAEAEAFIAEIKAQYKDATHNVPAMVIGDKSQIQWASDDGEPQGTSGAPIVQMLVSEGLTNLVIVVTRYFGGIKLGTGGLVRAYTSSAKLGLEAAGICDIEEMCVQTWDVDYTHLAKIQNMAGTPGVNGGFSIEEIRYTDVVSLDLACVPEDAEGVISQLTNVTAGRGTLKTQESRLVKRLI